MIMKVYVIYMHPSKDSFNGAILEKMLHSLAQLNVQVEVKNLYKEFQDAHLSLEEYEQSMNGKYAEDVLQEHKKIMEADQFIFLFPVWWGGFPAIGKGYLDRILSYGFAYELEGESPIPLLKGKKASLVFTTGAPEKEFHQSGMYDHMIHLLDKSVFQFCGIELDQILHFGDVIQKSDSDRKQMLDHVENFCARIQ
jgi:NAD(P)H dehydrogenase (quinone)